MVMYIVGEVDNEKGWDFSGIYSTEQLAVNRCVDENHFIAKVHLDKEIPLEKCQFEYAYYPKLEDKPKNKNNV